MKHKDAFPSTSMGEDENMLGLLLLFFFMLAASATILYPSHWNFKTYLIYGLQATSYSTVHKGCRLVRPNVRRMLGLALTWRPDLN